MNDQNLTKLKIADRLLNNYQEKIAFFYRFKPSNHKTQKSRFLKGRVKNPFFKYRQPKIDLGYFKSNLKKLRIDTSLFPGVLLKQKRKELLLKIKIIEKRGQTGKINFFSKKLFGQPGPRLVEKAERILKKRVLKTKSPRVSAQKAAGLIEKQLARHGLFYRAVFKRTNARLSVLKNTVRINPQTICSRKELGGLINHELTHAFRRENGLAQPWKIFKLGFPEYLGTEEGLAVYNEIFFGKSKEKLRLFAARVIACHLAEKRDFRFVFEQLRAKGFSRAQAWQITLRAKRGSGDTSKKGAFFKDYLYLAGYFKVKSFLEKGGNPLLLYYGKTGLNDIKSLSNFKRLKYPKHFFSYKN